MSANDTQVGGDHYKSAVGIQHWDFVTLNNIDYLRAQIIKYVQRWKKKNGVQDLQKAQHFYQKLLEVPRQPIQRELWSSPLDAYVAANEVEAEEAAIIDAVLTNGTETLRQGKQHLDALVALHTLAEEQRE